MRKIKMGASTNIQQAMRAVYIHSLRVLGFEDVDGG